MNKLSAKTTFDTVSHVIDSYRNRDPLIVRKKFSVCDTVYRRGCPEHEVVKAELSFDTEFLAITLFILISAAAIIVAVS